MLRLALKSVLANKIRFALTALAVVVGVGFVVAAFVTADSLRSTFGDLATDISEGADFTVRGELAFGDLTNTVAPAVPESVLDEVRSVEGVVAAEGAFFVNGVFPVDGSGETPSGLGGPVAGTNWSPDETLFQLFLIEGERPMGPSEFAVDTETYANFDFTLGNAYQVITPTGPKEFTLAGVMQFGFPENAGVGAVFTVFDTETAQTVLGLPGSFNQISVRAEPGSDIEALRQQIAEVLPAGVEVITAADVVEEFTDAFESFIGVFQTVLLTFAFIVLFVSAFIISNTFNIILGQRVRELSLLRAVGATPSQVRRSVLIESVVIGVLATALGLGLGMLGALGLKGLFSVLGATLPDGPLPLNGRTILWAAVMGIGLTVVASLIPASKASRISPVVGLGDHGITTRRRGLLWRGIAGGLMAALGLMLTGLGLYGEFDSTTAQLVSLGAGAAIVFVAVAVLSPLIAGPVVAALARPLRYVLGTAGRLAGDNASRSPRRTAATAVALTIGLALVSMVSVVGQSLRVTFIDNLSSAVEADYLISIESPAGMPKTVASDLQAADVGSVVAFDSDLVVLSSEADPALQDETAITITDLNLIEDVVNLDISAGSIDGIDPNRDVLVQADTAEEWGLAVGDEVTLEFLSGNALSLRVAAIFVQDAFWENWLIDRSLYQQFVTSSFDVLVTVKTDIDDPAIARSRIEQTLANYPQLDLEDRQEFQQNTEDQLNNLLVLVNVFLLFALLIALVGIINTLTLSVFERTREIGLLRAVGMTRRQLRRMIRWEAAAISLYGGVIGVGLGLAFGVATAIAIPDNIVNQASIPVVQLLLFVAASVMAGLLAAIFPAFRAGRMNVLEAIATE